MIEFRFLDLRLIDLRLEEEILKIEAQAISPSGG